MITDRGLECIQKCIRENAFNIYLETRNAKLGLYLINCKVIRNEKNE